MTKPRCLRTVWALLLSLGGLAVAAESADAPSFDDVSRRAAQAREGSRLAEAIDLYPQGVALRPRWDEGWWYLATLSYESDRFAEARDAFVSFLGVKPGAPPALAMLGLCESRLGDFQSAVEHLTQGIQGGIGSAEILRSARYHQALLLVKGGQFELAVEPCVRLARAESESEGLLDLVGLMLLRRPMLPSEVAEGDRRLVRLAGRAGYLHLARRGEEAEKAFAALVGEYPTTPWVRYAHGVFLLGSDADAALRELRRETELQPDAAFAHLQIAFELLRRNDFTGARAAAERSVVLAPDVFAAHNALGRALLELGEVEAGTAELEAAVRLAPESPEMHFALARAYARAGRKEDADRARANFVRLNERRGRESGQGPSDELSPEPHR